MDSQRIGGNGMVGDGSPTPMGTIVLGDGEPSVVRGRTDPDHAEPLPDRSDDHAAGSTHMVDLANRQREANRKLSRAELEQLFATLRFDYPGRKSTGIPATATRRRRTDLRLELARKRARATRISQRIRGVVPRHATATAAELAGKSGGSPGPEQ